MNRNPQNLASVIVPITLVNSSGGNATGEIHGNFRVWVHGPDGQVVTGFNGMTPDGSLVVVTEIGTTGVYLFKFPTTAVTKAFLISDSGPYTLVVDSTTTGIDPTCTEVWIGTVHVAEEVWSKLLTVTGAPSVSTATVLTGIYNGLFYPTDGALDLLTALTTNVQAVKTQTDNLPVDPASSGEVAAGVLLANNINTKTQNLPASPASASDVMALLSTPISEGYASVGATPTLSQALSMLLALLGNTSIVGTTLTAKKLDGGTPAMTYTLNDATAPTSKTRAS